jgi:hypothetical protein
MKAIGVVGDAIPGKSAVELIATGSVLESSREASGLKAQAAVRSALPADESRETMSNTGIQTSLARFAKIAFIDQVIPSRQPLARRKTELARTLRRPWLKCAAGKEKPAPRGGMSTLLR